MCGIIGFVRRGAESLDRDRRIAQAMCDVIRHRGPDERGLFADDAVVMGMCRLSIIDLAGGHQPMETADGRFVVVYNGEVYNFQALRDEMRAAGATFATQSDTEVVLQLFAREGIRSFRRLTGMFAIAVYDRQERRLVLCRDPIGIKPLYYCRRGATLVFGSEIKALLVHPEVRRELHMPAVWDYLTFEYVPGPQTVFRDIRKLRPGHFLDIDLRDGTGEPVEYRDLPREAVPAGDESEAGVQARFDDLLRGVVRSQLVADVPVGVFISGGLDSSAVAAAAREIVGAPLKTFCLGFEEPTLTDEAAHARATAAFLGTDHHEYVTNAAEYLGFVRDYVYYMDEPDADMAAIGKYFASRLASGLVKVVLSGEGGDEMLAGYRLDEAMRRFDQLRRLQRLPRRAACDAPAALLRRVGLGSAAGRLERAFVPLEERAAVALPSMTRQYSEAEKERLFREPPPDRTESMAVLKADFERARALPPLGQIQYAWSKQWLADHLLMQADRMSMACSLELRVPLLDLRLADFLFRLPDQCKIRRVGGRYRSKYLLRRFLEGRVPAEVLSRPKRGFQIPNTRFVSVDLRAEIEAALTGRDTRVVAFLKPEEIRARLGRAGPGAGETACQRVWILFVLEMWCRRWLG